MTEEGKGSFLKDLLLSGCNVNQINFGNGYQQINYGDCQQKRYSDTAEADETDYEEVDSENGHDNSEGAGNDDFASRVRKATEVMREERILKNKYDYAFIKMYMDEISDYPKFKSTQDFLDFLIDAGCKNVPGKSTFDAYYDKKAISKGEIKVKDDIVEEKRRNGIVKRFKELME